MRHFDVGVLGVGYWGKKIVDEYCNIPNMSTLKLSLTSWIRIWSSAAIDIM